MPSIGFPVSHRLHLTMSHGSRASAPWRSQLQQQTLHCAPPVLPTRVVLVLVKAIGQSCHIIEDAWSAFKDIIWNQKGITPTDEEVELFNGSGLSEGLGACAYVLPLQQARSM